jgi:hypothetical protein
MSDDRQPRAHPRDLICDALRGLDQAGVQFADGGSESGPPLFDATLAGWRLDVQSEWNDATGAGEPLLAYRFYVDHVGMRRADGLALYLSALRAAGLPASLGPAYRGSGRQVVWLEGRYDGDGRRLD